MTTSIKVLSLLFVITLSFACANKNDNAGVTNSTTASATNEATAQPITIKGTVLAVNYGKDGYSAEVKTEKEGSFVALVSIVNLGGPGKYQQLGNWRWKHALVFPALLGLAVILFYTVGNNGR